MTYQIVGAAPSSFTFLRFLFCTHTHTHTHAHVYLTDMFRCISTNRQSYGFLLATTKKGDKKKVGVRYETVDVVSLAEFL